MTSEPPPSRETPWRLAGSVVGGLLLVLSFPPLDLVWVAPPALALLTLSWHGARPRVGLLAGYLAGLAFLLGHLGWMRVVGTDAWIVLAASFALFYALIGIGVAATSRLRWWPLLVPMMWVLGEALRDRVPLGGFPWGRLAFGQADTTLTPYAALAGAPLVTFASALLGALLAYAWLERHRPRAALAALVGVALVSTAGGLVPVPTAGQSVAGPESVTAAVVQGNVPEPGMDFFGEREAVLRNHVEQTEKLAADVEAGLVPQPDVVIWPENSSDIDPFRDARAAALIQRAVDAIDVPVLVGAVVTSPVDPTRVRNMAIEWLPTSTGTPGPSDVYIKQHPVPFGEWVPAREILASLIGRFDRVPRDFEAGDTTGVMDIDGLRLGVLICFEVAYDELSRAAVRGDGVAPELEGQGARILAVQTNNATYALTGQPEQQLAMSRLRAIEHGRTVLIAATSGISAIVAPDGSLSGVLPEFTAGYLVQDVVLRDSLTIADRVGAVPELLVAGLSVAVLLGLAVRRRDTADVGSEATDPSQEPVP
jgi:apolipoprotein N-acyltransferase